MMRRLQCFMVVILALVGCDSKKDASGTPSQQPAGGESKPPSTAPRAANVSATSSPTTNESILAVEAVEEPATRPAALLIVQGGEGELVYRGWPIHISYRRLDGTAGAAPALTVRGPSDVVPLAAPKRPGEWLIAPDKSAALLPGNYIFAAGAAVATVVVADPPGELSPEQKEAWQIALASHAALMGDAPGAERIARDWITAAPSSPNAREALGDALLAGGKTDDALKAYNEALLRTPPSDQPPSSLYAKAAVLRQKLMMAMPVTPGTATSADDVAYYKIVDDGDALVASGDYARALGAYNRARSYYASKKLTLGLEELDRKVAYARAQPNRPTTAPTTKSAPR